MSNHRTVMEIIRVGCKRIRALVNDPKCWDADEIRFATDRMEQQAADEVARQFHEDHNRSVQ